MEGNIVAGRIVNVLEADAIITLISPRKGLLREVAYRVDAHYKDKEFDESDLNGGIRDQQQLILWKLPHEYGNYARNDGSL